MILLGLVLILLNHPRIGRQSVKQRVNHARRAPRRDRPGGEIAAPGVKARIAR